MEVLHVTTNHISFLISHCSKVGTTVDWCLGATELHFSLLQFLYICPNMLSEYMLYTYAVLGAEVVLGLGSARLHSTCSPHHRALALVACVICDTGFWGYLLYKYTCSKIVMSTMTCRRPQMVNWKGAWFKIKYAVLNVSPLVHIRTILMLKKTNKKNNKKSANRLIKQQKINTFPNS